MMMLLMPLVRSLLCVLLPPFFVIAMETNEKDIRTEVSFVTTALGQHGFIPQKDETLAFRGDSRSPEEMREAGGFFRKAFGDSSVFPSFRVDGGVRHMIGFSRDILVAMGFARYNVNVQREDQSPSNEGWVYASYLSPDLYYDATKYPHAFLADWGREVDAIYVPFNHLIGAIKVSTSDPLCIHCYLTRIPQNLHACRGCKTPYVDQFTLNVQEIWFNPSLSTSLSAEMIHPYQEQLQKIYKAGKYTVCLNQEDTPEATRIADRYQKYWDACKVFSCADKDLTALLLPQPGIGYIPGLL